MQYNNGMQDVAGGDGPEGHMTVPAHDPRAHRLLQSGTAEPITIVCGLHPSRSAYRATFTLGHALETDIRRILAVTFFDPPAKLIAG